MEDYQDSVYVFEKQHVTVRTHYLEYHCRESGLCRPAYVSVQRWEIFVNGELVFTVHSLEDLLSVFGIVQATIEATR